MAKLYVCDDDTAHLELLNKQISILLRDGSVELEVVISTVDPYELIKSIDTTSKNIYVLDVELNTTINGIRLGEEIRKIDKVGIIIFVTSFCEYRDLTFKYKLEAYDYLLKSLIFKDQHLLAQTIRDSIERLYHEKQLRKDFFVIKDSITHEIPYEELYIFKTTNKPRQLTLMSQRGCYYFNGTIDQVMLQMGHEFIRCHRSFAVNVSKIIGIDKRNHIVYFDNDLSAPVSKKGLKVLLERI